MAVCRYDRAIGRCVKTRSPAKAELRAQIKNSDMKRTPYCELMKRKVSQGTEPLN